MDGEAPVRAWCQVDGAAAAPDDAPDQRETHTSPTLILGGLRCVAIREHAFGVRMRDAGPGVDHLDADAVVVPEVHGDGSDRKSTRLNSSHANISYAVFC